MVNVFFIIIIDGYICIQYMIRPFPSIYLYERFGTIRIPTTFDDMEQFSEDITILMNF